MGTTSTEKRFAFLLLLFKAGGFPLTTKKLSLFQYTYNTAVNVSSYSVYLAVIFNVYMDMDNLESGMTALCHLLVIIAILCTEVNYRFRMKTLEQLFHIIESFTWEDMPLKDPETGELTMAGWIPRLETIIKKCMPVSLTIHFIQTGVRFLTTSNVIYDTHYPFDITVTPVYEIILMTQLFAMARLTILFYGPLYLYITLICVACTQIQKVKSSLFEIKQKHSKALEMSPDYDKKFDEEEICIIQNKLNSIVRLHQQVVSYVITLEDVMTMLLGGVLFFLLLTQCTAAFAAVLNLEKINDLSRVILVYVAATILASIYCSFGTTLTEEYESVKNAAWNCDWVGTPVSFQKCISLIISVANQGFTLTAAKFTPVCNVTLMNMINESMSLFMFLLTMKDKN